jgi:hypothetical protein
MAAIADLPEGGQSAQPAFAAAPGGPGVACRGSPDGGSHACPQSTVRAGHDDGIV